MDFWDKGAATSVRHASEILQKLRHNHSSTYFRKQLAVVNIMHSKIKHDCVIAGQLQSCCAKHHGQAFQTISGIYSPRSLSEWRVLDLAQTLQFTLNRSQVSKKKKGCLKLRGTSVPEKSRAIFDRWRISFTASGWDNHFNLPWVCRHLPFAQVNEVSCWKQTQELFNLHDFNQFILWRKRKQSAVWK